MSQTSLRSPKSQRSQIQSRCPKSLKSQRNPSRNHSCLNQTSQRNRRSRSPKSQKSLMSHHRNLPS